VVSRGVLASGQKGTSRAKNLWANGFDILFSEEPDWDTVIQLGVETREPSLDHARALMIANHLGYSISETQTLFDPFIWF
jgi:hypothetical protein